MVAHEATQSCEHWTTTHSASVLQACRTNGRAAPYGSFVAHVRLNGQPPLSIAELAHERRGMPDVPAPRMDVGWEEIEAVVDVLRSGAMETQNTVAQFESLFADWLGVEHAAAVSSGSAAVHLALRACGAGSGARIVTTPIAARSTTRHAIAMAGGVPVYANVDPVTWVVDPASVERLVQEGAEAIVAVHAFGQPCDMDALTSITERYDVPLVEDCCEAAGAEWQGRPVGSFGTGCFSCDEESTVCAAGGGMVATPGLFHALSVRDLRETATGFDCRMPEMCGAVGARRMERMKGYAELRRENMELLRDALAGCPGVLMPARAAGATPSGQWLPLAVRDARAARGVWDAAREWGLVATCISLPWDVCLEGYSADTDTGRVCGPEGVVVSLLIDPMSTRDELHGIAESIRSRCEAACGLRG